MTRLRIASARVLPIRLELAQPLATARAEIRERRGFLLELCDASGARGSGEALPLPAFAGEDRAACERALVAGARALLAAPESPLAWLLERAARAGKQAPVAGAALDVALHDLAARRRDLPLAALLAPAPLARIPLCALVAGADRGSLLRAARAAVAAGFGCLKLKLGARPPGRDLARVESLRAALGPGVALRLDANGAWSEAQALAAVARLAGCGIELLEQPVAAEDTAALARVARAAPFPIAADEALALPGASDRLLGEDRVGALVLKLPVLGGLRPALALAERARRAGVAVVVTSFLDSSLGQLAAAALAAALGAGAHASGLATSALLRGDLCRAPGIERGELLLPRGAGLGAEPEPRALAALACGPALELAR